MLFRWKVFVIFSFSVSRCCVPISVFLLGVKKGAGRALMACTPAASGIDGGHLAKRSCLSCQKQRRENNNKVFLALEENRRKDEQEKIFEEKK